MSVVSWWRSLDDEKRLSQGDVIDQVSFSALSRPETPLVKADAPGNRGIWKPTTWTPDAGGFCHCLARARRAPALVLTESCQLDKPEERKRRVIVAPVHVLKDHESKPENREWIMAGNRIAFAPLPGVPVLGDCYADLRLLVTVPREELDERTRLATMTPEAVDFLKQRIVGFFVRPGAPRQPADAKPAGVE
jgi:hypothetical protein